MRSSFICVLVLLVFWAVPGCSSSESRHTATIVIAEGNSLLYKRVGKNEPIIRYGAGDRVVVELENDTCYVNGKPHWPQPQLPPEMDSLDVLKRSYGRVPAVLEYVKSHRGDETEVWNEAYRSWEKQRQSLHSKVARRYMSDLRNGQTPDAAEDSALVALRASPLVASARVDERLLGPSRIRRIQVRWAGIDDEVGLLFEPNLLPTPPPPRMTLDGFKDFVHLLRSLERKGPVMIELRGGNLNYISGEEAVRRRSKS